MLTIITYLASDLAISYADYCFKMPYLHGVFVAVTISRTGFHSTRVSYRLLICGPMRKRYF